MILSELLKELKAITKVHPEAGEAQVWASPGHGKSFIVSFIRLDEKGKQVKVRLEE